MPANKILRKFTDQDFAILGCLVQADATISKIDDDLIPNKKCYFIMHGSLIEKLVAQNIYSDSSYILKLIK